MVAQLWQEQVMKLCDSGTYFQKQEVANVDHWEVIMESMESLAVVIQPSSPATPILDEIFYRKYIMCTKMIVNMNCLYYQYII